MADPINLKTDPFRMENLVGLAITDRFAVDVDQDGKISTTGAVREVPLSDEQAEVCATRLLHSLLAKTDKPLKFTKAAAVKLEKNYHDQIAVLKRSLLIDGTGANEDAIRRDALELIFSISRQQPILFTEQREVSRWVGLVNALVEGNREQALPYEATDSVQLLINALEASRPRFVADRNYLVLPQHKDAEHIKDAGFRGFAFDQYILELQQFLEAQKELQHKAFLEAHEAASEAASTPSVNLVDTEKTYEDAGIEPVYGRERYNGSWVKNPLRMVEDPRELSEEALEARDRAAAQVNEAKQ